MNIPLRTPVVLLPGMGCSAALWKNVVPLLQESLPTVCIITPELTGATIDSCIDELLTTLPERCALAGLSLGGIIAMAFARRAPGRLSGLCLMSTNPQAPTDTQREAWATQRRRLAHGAHASDLQRDLLPVLLSPGQSKATQESVVSMATAIGDEAFDAQLAIQATRRDERAGLSRVSVPSLVMAAEEDALCPPSWHVDMARRIPDAHLVRIAGSGHLSPLEAPKHVAAAMVPWIRASCSPVALAQV